MPRSSSKVPLDPTDPLVQAKLAERRAKQAAAQQRYRNAHRAEIRAKDAVTKRAQRQANPEEVRAKDRARYHKDPVKTQLKQKASRDKRKDKQQIYNQQYYEKNAERILQQQKDAYHANPEPRKASSGLYRRTNPEKVNAANRRWRAANPEKARASVHQWTVLHPEAPRSATRRHHARKRGAAIADVSRAQEKEILAVYGRCMYCPDDCPECRAGTHILELDHITAVKKDGNDTVQNLIPACRSCNSRKNVGPPLRPVQPLLLTMAPARKKRRAS